MKTRSLDSQAADDLLIEATKKLLWLRRKDRWTMELPKRCPPILWFGNSQSSKPIVLTLAANPSRQEYLQDSSRQALDKVKATKDESLLTYLEPPNNRFRLLTTNESLKRILVDGKLRAEIVQGYNGYFCTNPYRQWFGHAKEDSYKAEGFLRGMGASYYHVDSMPYQAVHIDLLPFATLSNFNQLKDQAEGDLFQCGWAEEVVTSLIGLLRPTVVVMFGRSNVNLFAKHMDSSVSRLPWMPYQGASYRLGQAEQLRVKVVGLSVNLGNPKGFDRNTLRDFGSHIGNQLGRKTR